MSDITTLQQTIIIIDKMIDDKKEMLGNPGRSNNELLYEIQSLCIMKMKIKELMEEL